MLKKTLLRLTLAAAVALGTVGVANASNVTGPYVGGQLGWGDTHVTSLSDYPGHGNVSNTIGILNAIPWSTYSTSSSNDDNGLAGRLFVGYQFTPNLALEFGYAKFHNATVKGSNNGTIVWDPSDTDTVNYSYKGVTREQAFDLAAKGIVPLRSDVSVYGKVGVAYVQQRMVLTDSMTASSTAPDFGTVVAPPHRYAKSSNKFLPEFGVGVSYDITPNVPIDLSWTHIQRTSGSIQNIDYAMLGVAYKFND